MNRIIEENILQLSVPERIQLVEDIWDSILLFPESIELSDEQKKELDRRLEAYHLNPGNGIPWNTLKSNLLNNDK
ncbi:MAG: addiction module protein [Spirochaetales bacterium]|jgi:putative addiction module component (TIGR02574 family)|nr:addiction module protein [Spirochaetales bacterium]